MKIHDQVSSIFWIIVGIYVAVIAYRLGLGSLHQPGPGFIFFGASFLLIILGFVDLVKSLIGKRGGEQKEGSIWSGFRWQKVLVVLSCLSAYAYFLDTIGFILSTFLIMLFLFKVLEPTRWWGAVLGSCGIVLVSYFMFKVWLKVPFPVGYWGF